MLVLDSRVGIAFLELIPAAVKFISLLLLRYRVVLCANCVPNKFLFDDDMLFIITPFNYFYDYVKEPFYDESMF